MNKAQLFAQIRLKQSYLCIGLDTDINKIPKHLLNLEDPVFEFNRQIVEATLDLCVAYKPNIAFYEALGRKGWESLEKTVAILPENCFSIADAKRGDIGNTSELYARAFFSQMNFDSITVAPYMGADSVKPFLGHENKWVILLALTSNAGSHDFQLLPTNAEGTEMLFERVLKTSQQWGSADQLMYVVGATQTAYIKKVREIVPDHFLLVPGVGAQGGSLSEISQHGFNKECGLLVNSSRQIIYASSGEDFAEKARAAAKEVQQEMARLLDKYLPA
ncbi:orotidine-5'-phosphate decarboxylase [Adhaeribacter soli]|uniref:Orotidine-5'-phosphate decarboxylase n=1 Tax=Adhaeribacter soli TaxID=2607655 RepID=A0A5N1J1Z1_9BACT|nr:orotidine-5'-phosphate decarboxylase [Adhaeribacter soli]KAA9340599.1 orotidine-5'-phosphate decarboxylase [Adhaeribacter soli]